MTPRSSVVPYLTDIIEAIEHVREKAGTSALEEFKADWEQQWIVQRGIEIVCRADPNAATWNRGKPPFSVDRKIRALTLILQHVGRLFDPYVRQTALRVSSKTWAP